MKLQEAKTLELWSIFRPFSQFVTVTSTDANPVTVIACNSKAYISIQP